jgi:hypothetical protein
MLYNQFIQFTPDVSLLTGIANSIIVKGELSIIWETFKEKSEYT